MNLEAIGFRVLVKTDVIEDKVDCGEGKIIYKPQQVVDQEQGGVDRGEVVHIGPMAFEDEGGQRMWCKVGDRVIWPRYAGRPVKDEGVLYHVLNDKDILLKDNRKV